MHEHLHEYCDSRGASLRVDRTAGVIRGIKILGLESRNGRRYAPDTLARAINLYEGAKVNVNHPKGPPHGPRDYQDRIGVVRNVALRPDVGLFGDFHFNPKHALAEQLLWDAEHSPENVGFSHNVTARTKKEGDRVLVEEIVRVQSVDLVADPATTRGLFEAAPDASAPSPPSSPPAADALPRETPSLETISLAELRAARPDLCQELLREEGSLVTELQAELDRLRRAEAKHVRRELIRRLLAEHRLPSLESLTDDPAERTILSARFVALLEGVAEASEVHRLVEDRARLVNELRDRSATATRSKPLSRDQMTTEPLHLAVHNVNEFVKSIRG